MCILYKIGKNNNFRYTNIILGWEKEEQAN